MFRKLMNRFRLWWYGGNIGLIAQTVHEEGGNTPKRESKVRINPRFDLFNRLPEVSNATNNEVIGRCGVKITFADKIEYSDGSTSEITIRTSEEAKRAFEEHERFVREEAQKAYLASPR